MHEKSAEDAVRITRYRKKRAESKAGTHFFDLRLLIHALTFLIELKLTLPCGTASRYPNINWHYYAANRKTLVTGLGKTIEIKMLIGKVIVGTHHGVESKYLGQYLAEYAFRFNRRHDPDSLFFRALGACVIAKPKTQQSLYR